MIGDIVRHKALELLQLPAVGDAVLEIHTRNHSNLAVASPPHVLAKQHRLALETFALLVVVCTEAQALGNRLGAKDGGAVPARKGLERAQRLKAGLRIRRIPKEVVCFAPVAVGRDVEEGVAVHASRDPDVVERGILARVRPVHGARHVGVERLLLQYQLQDVLGTRRHVVEEDDAGVVRHGQSSLEDGLQGHVSQRGELGDAVALGGVDGGRVVDVSDAECLKAGPESGENISGAVGRVSLYNREST